MRMLVQTALLGLVALQTTLATAATEHYVEIDWLRSEYADRHHNGLAVRGGFALSQQAHAFADYRRVDVDSFDLDAWRLGLGLEIPLSERVELTGAVALERREDLAITTFSTGFGTPQRFVNRFHRDGASLELGLRARPSEAFEISAAYRYVKLDGPDNDPLILNGLYRWSDRWGLQLTLEHDDQTSLLVGPRLSF